MDSNCMAVGRRIADLRKSRGYTREKLSELSEISTQFIAEIEKGRKNMTVTTLRKLARALIVSTDYIVNGNCADGDDCGVELMMNSLSGENKKQAEKMLTLFIETINLNSEPKQREQK